MDAIDRKKILVVDDEIDQVAIIKKTLEASGYQVDSAYDGKEAIDKVRIFSPQLIILDIMMPLMDGYEVCATLSSDQNYQDIPIIMLTIKTKALDIKRGMDAGAISYIQKPFKIEMLLSLVKGAIG